MQVFFRVVQLGGGRVQAIAGVQEGLYSVFAGFDRDLFETYHLFFVDGSYHTEQLNLGEAYHRIKNQVERSCSSKIIKTNIRGENFWNCYFESGEITAYTLATDQNGSSFKQQAIEYMKDTLGIQGVQLLLEQAKEKEQLEITEDGDVYLKEGQDALQNYETEKNQHSTSESQEEVNVPKDFVNPLEVVKEIRTKGILSLVLPASAQLSEESVEKKELASVRDKEVGMGIEKENSNDLVENVLFQAYLSSHLNCYTDTVENGGLQYELEYVLAGNTSDVENLKEVVTKLLGVREAANMVYLMKDPVKQQELKKMSLLICSVVGLPVLEGVVRLALAAAWSFGESLLDVRQLLLGGNVPFLKTKDTWQLSIDGFGELMEFLKDDEKIDQDGMSYEGYLNILLGIQNENQQVNRTIDIVENTMRTEKERPTFRMDYCFDYMEVNMHMKCNRQKFSILRDYGYGM